MKFGVGAFLQTSRPSSNLGVIAPWVCTPKMWHWASAIFVLIYFFSFSVPVIL